MLIAQLARPVGSEIELVRSVAETAWRLVGVALVLLTIAAVAALAVRGWNRAGQDPARGRRAGRLSVVLGVALALAVVLPTAAIGVVGLDVGYLWAVANDLARAPLVLAAVAVGAYRLGQLDGHGRGAPRGSHGVPADEARPAP